MTLWAKTKNNVFIKTDRQKRSIIFGNKIFFLQFPPLLFNVKFKRSMFGYCLRELHVYFLNEMEQLFRPPLPNVVSYAKVCLGEATFAARNLKTLAKNVLDNFYQSEFTPTVGSIYEIYSYQINQYQIRNLWHLNNQPWLYFRICGFESILNFWQQWPDIFLTMLIPVPVSNIQLDILAWENFK